MKPLNTIDCVDRYVLLAYTGCKLSGAMELACTELRDGRQ